MNYRIRIFFYVETQLIMPVEELYSLESEGWGSTYLEKYVEEMKWQLFHGINKEMLNPPEIMDKFCVLVEPVPNKEKISEDMIMHIEKRISDYLKKSGNIFIRTKKGMKIINVK